MSDLHLVLQLFGMLLIGVTLWALFPRFTADYSGGIVADPDEFPMLNHTVELIANALQVEVPRLVLTDQFDATFGRIGLRRQPVLVLGHPFLVLLEPQELVSLIAHEIAHDRDGTITRSMFVQTAYNAVNRWKRMLKPSNFYWRNIPLVPLMMAAAIAWIPIQLFSLFFNLIKQRESHHAEYEADRLSIFISGNGSAESLMRKSLYGHMVPLRQAYATASPDAKFNAISKSLETIPAKEFERLWRIADIIANRTANKTHPSFQNRLQFVNSFDEILPVVRLSKTQFASLQTELKRWPSVWSRHQSQGGNKPPSNPHNHGVVMASGD